MSPKRVHPSSEHGSFNLANTYPVNLQERAATGRLMGERALSYLGVTLEHLGQVMPEDLERVEVPALRLGLYGVTTGRRISNLAVNETEYNVVIRNAEAFTESVRSVTSQARLIDPVPTRREAATERSVSHAVDSKEETFNGLMEWLEVERSRLVLFRQEIRTPHLSHMKDAALRQLAGSIWEFSFGNILNVVAHQQGWTAEQLEDAKRAMLEKMIHGKQQRRHWYWTDLTDLAIQYNKNKTSLFVTKMKQARAQAERAEAKAKSHERH